MTQADSTRPHFIVGTGRCGSTLLSTLIAEHPDALSLSELLSAIGPERAFARDTLDGAELWRLLSEPRREIGDLLCASAVPEVDDGVDGYGVAPVFLVALRELSAQPRALLSELEEVTASLPHAAAGVGFGRVFDWLRERLGRKMWVERSGGSLAYVHHIRRWWPRARIVHLWRDGVATALSMSRHPYFRVGVARACARNPLLDVRAALAVEIPVDRFAAYWAAIVTRGLAVLEAHDRDDLLTVRYETLLDDPERELIRVARFLGFRENPEWLARCASRIKRPAIQPRDILSDCDRVALDRLCGPVRRKLQKLVE